MAKKNQPVPVEIPAEPVAVESANVPVVEPTELQKILDEIQEIKGKLPGLKKEDRNAFGKLHDRFLYLIGERDRLQGKTYG
jgi:hypothetical protein